MRGSHLMIHCAASDCRSPTKINTISLCDENKTEMLICMTYFTFPHFIGGGHSLTAANKVGASMANRGQKCLENGVSWCLSTAFKQECKTWNLHADGRQ